MVKGDSKPFANLIAELDEARKTCSNLLVVALPGFGLNSYFKKYQDQNNRVAIITPDNTEISDFNLIIMSSVWGGSIFSSIDSILRQANPSQKFCLGTTRPWIIHSPEYTSSYLSKHLYKTVWLKPYDSEDSAVIAKSYNRNLSNSDINKIHALSGGIPQLIKYLSINNKMLKSDIDTLVADHNLGHILSPIVDAIQKTPVEYLEKLGALDANKVLVSNLLSAFSESTPVSGIAIQIGFDLSIKENGVNYGQKLTKSEAQILETMLKKSGQISKEEISDIKWGQGKYDQFSDQAIHKTMSRIAGKLRVHKITTVPQVGFIIKR